MSVKKTILQIDNNETKGRLHKIVNSVEKNENVEEKPKTKVNLCQKSNSKKKFGSTIDNIVRKFHIDHGCLKFRNLLGVVVGIDYKDFDCYKLSNKSGTHQQPDRSSINLLKKCRTETSIEIAKICVLQANTARNSCTKRFSTVTYVYYYISLEPKNLIKFLTHDKKIAL